MPSKTLGEHSKCLQGPNPKICYAAEHSPANSSEYHEHSTSEEEKAESCMCTVRTEAPGREVWEASICRDTMAQGLSPTDPRADPDPSLHSWVMHMTQVTPVQVFFSTHETQILLLIYTLFLERGNIRAGQLLGTSTHQAVHPHSVSSYSFLLMKLFSSQKNCITLLELC